MNRIKLMSAVVVGLFAASSAMAAPSAPKGPRGEDFCSVECGNFECWLAQKLFCPRTAPRANPEIQGYRVDGAPKD
ncbi:MAG: hypothetical protein JOZ90_06525 [Alphaproteobacteria bacterium]|nr:hypothetical protein [Alphaproteobacteria bacterium]MBV9370062.1 hypothetical protein [Alphaproteobacteria bacterium]MBV9900736.1 hypothetical protein [Alphaproteobacteria bacterium]